MPKVSPTLDPALWPLSLEGRRAAQELRQRLPPTARVWVASQELKAFETLQCLSPKDGGAILQDARFNEVQRDEPFDDDFRSRRRAWVEGKLDARHTGWETPQDAARRVDEAVREFAARGYPLIIGSHGMVLTAWLVHRARVQSGAEAGMFWEALAFPDLVEIDLD